MKFGSFLKTCLLGGLFVILPALLVVMAVGGAVKALRKVLHPFAGWAAADAPHPDLFALGVLIALCFAAGLLLRSSQARKVGAVLDGKLDKVPFYRVLQSLRKRVTGQDDTEAWSVALVELEEALVPAFVVEELPDGRYTVFVPSAPSPVSGAVYLIDGSRVHIVDVPFATAFRSMSQWGLGASALLAAYQERKLVPHR